MHMTSFGQRLSSWTLVNVSWNAPSSSWTVLPYWTSRSISNGWAAVSSADTMRGSRRMAAISRASASASASPTGIPLAIMPGDPFRRRPVCSTRSYALCLMTAAAAARFPPMLGSARTVPHRTSGSIVVASLEEVDPIVADEVDDPMLLGQPTRPDAGPEVLERLGLANSAERVTDDGLDQVEGADGD